MKMHPTSEQMGVNSPRPTYQANANNINEGEKNEVVCLRERVDVECTYLPRVRAKDKS